MGDAISRQCRDTQTQGARARDALICAIPLFFALILFVLLSFTWANPVDGVDDGDCERSNVVEATLAAVVMLGLAALTSICGVCCASFDAFCSALCCTLLFGLCFVGAALVSFFTLLVALGTTCTKDSAAFVYLLNALIAPGLLGLVALVALAPFCSPFEVVSPPCSLGMQALRALASAPQTLTAAFSSASAAAQRTTTTAATQRARSSHVPRAYRLLRDACALGDSYLVSLLLDTEGHRYDFLWRAHRCFLLGCCLCQCWPSCKLQREEGLPKQSAPRVSMDFMYEDDDLNWPVHYLALGRWHSGPSAPLKRGCLELWQELVSEFLPTWTDGKRARLFAKLVQRGLIDFAGLQAINQRGRTPLHCAALTGSTEMLVAIHQQLTLLGLGQELLNKQDFTGDTPLTLALSSGHVVVASMLLGFVRDIGVSLAEFAGPTGRWPCELGRHRKRVQQSLQALERVSCHHDEVCEEQIGPQTVLKGISGVLSHVEAQVQALQAGLRGTLPAEAAQALLKHHSFYVSDALRAYEEDPRAALDAAGLADIPLPEFAGEPISLGEADVPDDFTSRQVGIHIAAPSCIVCMEQVQQGSLACGHLTCRSCLRGHVRARIEEGDANGLVCPWPECKCVISNALVEKLFRIEQSDLMYEEADLEAGERLEDSAACNEDFAAIWERLQALRAQEFVNASQNVSWCPQPGCGHVVHSSARGTSPWPAETLQCSCGVSFCSSCHELDGHDPATCEQWRKWKKQQQEEAREGSAATERWILENAQTCPKCATHIARNGGCNHMVCRSCGQHFCYVCGRDWSLHQQQFGRVDYYNCHLGRQPDHLDQTSSVHACLNGFRANIRDEEAERRCANLAAVLAEEMDVDPAFVGFVRDAVAVSLQARRVLRCSYVLKANMNSDTGRTGLTQCMAELEVSTAKLENVTGVSFFVAARRTAGLDQAHVSSLAPLQELARLDLREPFAHITAVTSYVEFAAQLSMAVRLQTQRLLNSGRVLRELAPDPVVAATASSAWTPFAWATLLGRRLWGDPEAGDRGGGASNDPHTQVIGARV